MDLWIESEEGIWFNWNKVIWIESRPSNEKDDEYCCQYETHVKFVNNQDILFISCPFEYWDINSQEYRRFLSHELQDYEKCLLRVISEFSDENPVIDNYILRTIAEDKFLESCQENGMNILLYYPGESSDETDV